MPTNVVFVAPFFIETTMRFIKAVSSVEDVRLGLVSQDPLERLPPEIAGRLTAHWRVDDALDPSQIGSAVESLAARMGGVERLLAVLEHLQVPLALVRESLQIEGMGVAAAQNFRDKSRMKTVLRKAGVPCARHALASDGAEAHRFAGTVGYPVVVKPPAGAGARDTFRVGSARELDQILRLMSPSATRPFLLEEFMAGAEHSFDTVSIRGKHVWHSLTRYQPTPLEVMENQWIQWCVLLPREIDDPGFDDIRQVAGRALDALEMGTGLSHMEWFRRSDGTVAVSEVGARPPGAQITTLIGHAHGFDLYRAWARLMVHERFDAPARGSAAGIAYLRGQGAGRVKAIHGLDQAQAEMGALVVEAHLPKPGQTPSMSYEGDGFVILRHRETRVVEEALRRLVTLVRVELG